MNNQLPFGAYTDKILQYANETFSTLHHKFLKEIWGDNKTSCKLHRNQCVTDWQAGTYEAYIPTTDSLEYNLKYLRVAIQVLPYNSNSNKREDAYQLMNHLQEPLGEVDSELLVLVAPQQDKWGLVRGFKHRAKRGYFTAVFTNRSPEIVWKRVLDHIHNFIAKRLDGLMTSLKIEPWVWKWSMNKENNMLYYNILEHYSFVIRQSVFTFLNLVRHFRGEMVRVLHCIGLQNTAFSALKSLSHVESHDLSVVFGLIQQGLKEKLVEDAQRLYGRELMLLQVYRRG